MIDPRLLMPSQPPKKGEGMREIARMIMSQRPTTPPKSTPFAHPMDGDAAMQRIYDALKDADKMLVDDELKRGAPMWQTINGSPPLPQDPVTPQLNGPGVPEPLDPMLEEHPGGMFYDIEGRNRFDDANAYQVAQADTGTRTDATFADKARELGLDLNVTQAQRTGQALRLLQAESVLRDLEGQGTRTGQRMLEWLPGNSENLVMDDDYARFVQARDMFAEAAMRADTGATINESEWPRILRNLMPQPGDSPERLAQRRAAREVFIQSLAASAGEAQGIMPEIGQPVVPIQNTNPSEMSDEDLLRALQGGN